MLKSDPTNKKPSSDVQPYHRFRTLIINIATVAFIIVFLFFNPLRLLFKKIENAFDPLLIVFLCFVAALVYIISLLKESGKANKLVQINEDKLGIRFIRKWNRSYYGEWNGYNIIYEMDNVNDKQNIYLKLLHHRRLNLMLRLTNKQETKLFSRLRALQSKPIELAISLKEKGIHCSVADEMLGRSFFGSDKVISGLLRLDEMVKSYNGEFLIDDNEIKMEFPYDTILEPVILESANQVSSAFSTSIMLPQSLPPKILIQRKILITLILGIIIAFLVYLIKYF